MTHPLFAKPTHTIGEFFTAVLGIHGEVAAARGFFDDYVAWNRTHVTDAQYRGQEGAERLARANIGWVFGEGMAPEDIAMWVEACAAAHPVFGAVLPASPREGLALGALLAVAPEVLPRLPQEHI